MPDIQEIYQETISRLPSEERRRLADLILKELADTHQLEEKLSIAELIKSFPAGRGFKTSAEADE